MATRVFLLSGDEKAVHAITQILDELEVSFEHSSDPAFTLKRLGGQRFEVLIVDCDNVQTATQVFNSARASALNKAAIAIAIVEGKAGVPNAFRLGASLVLTKPVSLEQVRNTLRTGIGMARKDGPESKLSSITPPAAAPSFPASTPLSTHPPAPAAPAPTPISVPAAVVASAPPVPAIPRTPSAPATPVLAVPASTVPSAPAIAAHAAPVLSRPSAPAPTPVPVSAHVPPVVIRSEAFPPPAAKAPNTIAEKPAPVPPSPVLSLGLTETKAPVAKPFDSPSGLPLSPSLPRATSDGAAAAPALSKTPPSSLTIAKEPEKAPLKLDEEKLFPDHEPAPLASLHESEPDLAEDSAASLRAQAVPAFGGLNKQPFAGLQPARRSHTGLIVGALLIAIAGGTAAAWYLKPEFRKVVEWKYAQVKERVAAWRGHSAPPPAALTPSATTVPPAAASQPTSMPPSVPQTSVNSPAPATAPANVSPNAAAAPSGQGASSAPASSSPAASTPAVTPAEKAAKPATPDAKPDVSKKPASPATAAAAAPAKLPGSTASHPAAGDILEVPEDFADDQVVHRVHPVYPKQARGKKLQGSVVLQAIVDRQGKVNSLQLVSGDPILAQAAADAVKQWRYKPYSHNGEPSFFQTRVTVDFHLP